MTEYVLCSGCLASTAFLCKDQCQSLEDALTTALWDEKKCLVEDVRLDDGTSDIDTLDALSTHLSGTSAGLSGTNRGDNNEIF